MKVVVQSKSWTWVIRCYIYSVKLYTVEIRGVSQTQIAYEFQMAFDFMLG